MNRDDETLGVYDERASEYAACGFSGAEKANLTAFIDAMPDGGHVLDLGCGPGHTAAIMQVAGLRVVATDGSKGMVALARQHPGITVRHETFNALHERDVFDGIWASFSLLHAPRDAFPEHLRAIKTALRPGGLFFLGMKTGTGEKRDRLGRFYTYYPIQELLRHLSDAGLQPDRHNVGRGAGLAGGQEEFIGIFAHG